MALEINTDMVGDTAVFRCVGTITLGEGQILVREHAKTLLGAGTNKLVLDFTSLRYIDSSGLGELASIYTTFRNRGGNVVVANANGKPYNSFRITRWDSFIKLFPDVEKAVAFLSSDLTAKP